VAGAHAQAHTAQTAAQAGDAGKPRRGKHRSLEAKLTYSVVVLYALDHYIGIAIANIADADVQHHGGTQGVIVIRAPRVVTLIKNAQLSERDRQTVRIDILIRAEAAEVKRHLHLVVEPVIDLDAGYVHLLIVRVDLLPVVDSKIVGGERDEF